MKIVKRGFTRVKVAALTRVKMSTNNNISNLI